ncbi:MAG: hypothetical protein LBB45_02085 [Methanobrevibacter sp.]|jgi:hypothetical protein|nr:hypothetical protein [Candidatus Methanovirga basalitermitum]
MVFILNLINCSIRDETGIASLSEILIGSLIIILFLSVFNVISEIHISTPQELNINEAQDVLDLISFKSSQNQISLLEKGMKKLEDDNFSKKSHGEVSKLFETYLNEYCNKNYQLIEFSSQNPIVIVSKGDFKNTDDFKTAVRNIGHYRFLFYVWD